MYKAYQVEILGVPFFGYEHSAKAIKNIVESCRMNCNMNWKVIVDMRRE